MLVGAALLVVLDGTILAGPGATRAILAVIVTVLVGGFIIATWISNTRLEKASSGREAGNQGRKPSA